MFEETSGTNPDNIFNTTSSRNPPWGISWGLAWGLAWGSPLDSPLSISSGTSPNDLFDISSDSGALYTMSSGTSPEEIYEVN